MVNKCSWKKLDNGYPFVKGYWKSKDGRYLTVKKISAAGKGKFRSPTTYVVASNHNFGKPIGEFKTQSAALRKARVYMKKSC